MEAGNSFPQVRLRRTLFYPLASQYNRKQYLIQVSWPWQWLSSIPPAGWKAPVIYVVDGNALFLTATEAAWRLASGPNYHGGGIVVGIGYLPEDEKDYEQRRAYDLTPSAPAAVGNDKFGGADQMLDFIQNQVRPLVRNLFGGLKIDREMLYGHSYGGLLALHALYTRPDAFDLFVASSPLVDWLDGYIFFEEQEFRQRGRATSYSGDKIQAGLHIRAENEAGSQSASKNAPVATAGHTERSKKPSLMLFYGGREQEPIRWRSESAEAFAAREKAALIRNMASIIPGIRDRLSGAGFLADVSLIGYPDEDHGTVIACTMSRSLTTFFEEWPIGSPRKTGS